MNMDLCAPPLLLVPEACSITSLQSPQPLDPPLKFSPAQQPPSQRSLPEPAPPASISDADAPSAPVPAAAASAVMARAPPLSVAARDEALAAKDAALAVAARHHRRLATEVDLLESELEALRQLTAAKTEENRLQLRESERLRRETAQLREALQLKDASKRGVEVAAAQNMRLLKLLEQEESKREVLMRERNDARVEASLLAAQARGAVQRQAASEAQLEAKCQRVAGDAAAAAAARGIAETALAALRTAAAERSAAAAAASAALRDEVERRAAEQYLLLEKLQRAEDDRDRWQDAHERRSDDAAAAAGQCADLERRL
ncbi:unnamed protein product, partial [Phaeothamnion confervicola]